MHCRYGSLIQKSGLILCHCSGLLLLSYSKIQLYIYLYATNICGCCELNILAQKKELPENFEQN